MIYFCFEPVLPNAVSPFFRMYFAGSAHDGSYAGHRIDMPLGIAAAIQDDTLESRFVSTTLHYRRFLPFHTASCSSLKLVVCLQSYVDMGGMFKIKESRVDLTR